MPTECAIDAKVLVLHLNAPSNLAAGIRIAFDAMLHRADALCQAVPLLAFTRRAVHLHQHAVINIGTERALRPGGIVRESADLLYDLVLLWHFASIALEHIWPEMRHCAEVMGISEKLPQKKFRLQCKMLFVALCVDF
jgi:hypothetical protein